jgi:hypothetical protein
LEPLKRTRAVPANYAAIIRMSVLLFARCDSLIAEIDSLFGKTYSLFNVSGKICGNPLIGRWKPLGPKGHAGKLGEEFPVFG